MIIKVIGSLVILLVLWGTYWCLLISDIMINKIYARVCCCWSYCCCCHHFAMLARFTKEQIFVIDLYKDAHHYHKHQFHLPKPCLKKHVFHFVFSIENCTSFSYVIFTILKRISSVNCNFELHYSTFKFKKSNPDGRLVQNEICILFPIKYWHPIKIEGVVIWRKKNIFGALTFCHEPHSLGPPFDDVIDDFLMISLGCTSWHTTRFRKW